MKKINLLDVIVVYTDGIATSASSEPKQNLPFAARSKRTHYNNAYAYFLEMCEKNDLKAGFTTSADIIGGGRCSSFWVYQKNKWLKVQSEGYAKLIFDKFSPLNKVQKDRRETLLSDVKIKTFNDSRLYSLFFDKNKTYEELKMFTVPTVAMTSGSDDSIDQKISSLKEMVLLHPHFKDFSKRFILKDRYGAGGNNIFCIDDIDSRKQVKTILAENKSIQFIFQPFLEFDTGYSYKEFSGFIDIRLIYLEGKIIQAYIRVAKKDEFRCNEHQGGTLEYIPLKDLPKKVLDLSAQIATLLDCNNTLYALDFVISNNGNIYLIEGNTGPGLDWNLSRKKNEQMAKKLIRLIVENLAEKIKLRRAHVLSLEVPLNPVM